MLDMFYILIGAIKNKNLLTEPLEKEELRKAIQHPLNIKEIIKFKHHKTINIVFWTMGILPPTISYITIIFVGKIKHLI